MSAVLITALAFSVSAANVNKYDWNKTVKWKMNKNDENSDRLKPVVSGYG